MKNNTKTNIMTGGQAAAQAMKQINPDVVAMYPITPQTPIIESFAKFAADGLVGTETIMAESEHSAMSACIGASAAGGRAMTATASVGLALMWEVTAVAAGLRLPIVMNIANRAISAPINIHCDHSDAMGARDIGWIQIYSENAQEVYEHNFLALKLAEHPDVMLPVMVMQDGFVTSHCAQNIRLLDDSRVKSFIGEYKPKKWLLDVGNPYTVGPLLLFDYLMEAKRQQADAMKKAKKIFLDIGKSLSKLTGNDYYYFEKYKMDDADAVVVVMNSTAGNAKAAVDALRKEGLKAGVLKIRLFRPFPYEEVRNALKNINKICVMDRSESYGADAPLYGEIKNALFELDKKPIVQSCIFGIGGRDIFVKEIENIFRNLLKGKAEGKVEKKIYAGLRE